MVKRYMPGIVRWIGHPSHTPVPGMVLADDGDWTAYDPARDYDALAAELARCRAANVYDGAAHKRVADLEAALREIAEFCDVENSSGYSIWMMVPSDLRDSKRKCAECVYDVRNPFVCERCGTSREPTVPETPEAMHARIVAETADAIAKERGLPQSETPVSTLCAICDQIKELHPATHEWTAKETTPNYDVPPYHLSKIVPDCVCQGCARLASQAETKGDAIDT